MKKFLFFIVFTMMIPSFVQAQISQESFLSIFGRSKNKSKDSKQSNAVKQPETPKECWLKDSIPYSQFNAKWGYSVNKFPTLLGATPTHVYKHVDFNGCLDSIRVMYENGALVSYMAGEDYIYEYGERKGKEDKVIYLSKINMPNGDYYDQNYKEPGQANAETTKKAEISYIDGKITAGGVKFNYTYSDKGIKGFNFDIVPTRRFLIEYKDGTKYEGSIGFDNRITDTWMEEKISQLFTSNSIAEMGIKYYDGILTYPDGAVECYLSGKSKTQRDGEYDERVKAREAREKAEREKYDRLCAQYGKKYADAAWKGYVIVGMPEKLMLDYVGVSLWHDSGSVKWYEIRRSKFAHVVGEKEMDVWDIRVENGRVTSISHHDAWK